MAAKTSLDTRPGTLRRHRRLTHPTIRDADGIPRSRPAVIARLATSASVRADVPFRPATGTNDAPRQAVDAAKRILVVEDELMIRMLLEDMLADLGYTVAAEAGAHRRGAERWPNNASSTSQSSTSISTASRFPRWSMPSSPAACLSSSPPAMASAAFRKPTRPPDAAEAVPDRRARTNAATALTARPKNNSR